MKSTLLLLLFGLQCAFLSAQNWQRVNPAPASDFEAPYVWNLMSVINVDTVWFADAFSGAVTRTLDGGKTWQTNLIVSDVENLFFDYYLNSLFATDAQQAYTVWLSYDGASSRTLRTTDGGETWQLAFPQAQFNKPDNSLKGLHFFNAQTGLAWSGSYRDTSEFYRSIDGGNTWTKIKTPRALRNTFSVETIDYTNFDTHGDTIWIGTSQGRVFKSNDQGASWSTATLPFSGLIVSIALNNGHQAALSVFGASIFLTSDGGKNWSEGIPRSADQGTGNQIFSIKNQSDVYISSNDADGWANISFDKCQTWDISLLQPGVNSLAQIKFIDAQTAWAIHNDSTVLKWANPPVLFDPVEPDYTAIKSEHATGIPTSGVRLAPWSLGASNYSVEHTLLKNGNVVSTLKRPLSLSPKKVSSSFSQAALSGKGDYILRTELSNSTNKVVQQHEVKLIAGDSVFAKDNDRTATIWFQNRGNFFDLQISDTLSSISAKVYAGTPTAVSFGVFGYNPVTQRYDQQLHLSAPVQITPEDVPIIIGGETFILQIFDNWVTYKLPKNLPLSPGNYVIGVLFENSQEGGIQMDARKVSKNALLIKGRINQVETIQGYGFTPMVRAHFHSKNLTVSTKDPDLAVGIKVFPNPSSDLLSFELPATLPEKLGDNQDMFLQLYNLNGQKTHQQVISPGLSTIRIDHLPRGIYLWQIGGSNGKIVAGMVVKQ